MGAAMRLADMHCHLDFADDARAVARQAAASGVAAFSNTVTPEGYLAAREALAGTPAVRVGLGLHPWWVEEGARGSARLDLFRSLASSERFIGEVGLDFSARHEAARGAQLAAFDQVLAACGEGGSGPRVLSVHAVRAASDVLDLLERRGVLRAGGACILHWFSGSGDELARAARMGCRFSVGARMLATRRGRAYARSIPARLLLLETDLPDAPGAPFDADAWTADLERALALLAEARGCDAEALRAQLAENAAELLGL